ncbi:MAG: D-glycero-beta-D-manno-heptose-7-phosphate kinase [Rikenellaceae bacterium]
MNIEINKLKNSKVLVVGDIMLDKYHIGSIKRISPEAPVPVVRVIRSYSVLGGAANLARNLVGLGTMPYIVGIVGDDDNGVIVNKKFTELGIEAMVVTTDLPTITKTRIIGNDQQVVRIDFEEERVKLANYVEKRVIEHVSSVIAEVDIVVISDYGKGLCNDTICSTVISLATEHGKEVIVDPKGTNWTKYQNATIITPNIKELSDISNKEIRNVDEEINEASREIIEKYNFKSLLVTRSEMGMSYVDNDQIIVIPTEAKEVFDVSGAGDTVVATLAAALAAKFSLKDSIYLANKAAGIVVGKVGTSPIVFHELQSKLYISNDDNKVFTASEIPNLMRILSLENKRIVFTNGCFDILHKGHVTYLQKAKNLGDILILGLNSDSSVRRLKGENRPINDEVARATVMAALSSVDYVVIFEDDTPLEVIKAIKPNVLVKGGDYKLEDIVGREFADETTTIPFVDGFSTTSIIEKGSK